jgi:hypothetical protein
MFLVVVVPLGIVLLIWVIAALTGVGAPKAPKRTVKAPDGASLPKW